MFNHHRCQWKDYLSLPLYFQKLWLLYPRTLNEPGGRYHVNWHLTSFLCMNLCKHLSKIHLYLDIIDENIFNVLTCIHFSIHLLYILGYLPRNTQQEWGDKNLSLQLSTNRVSSSVLGLEVLFCTIFLTLTISLIPDRQFIYEVINIVNTFRMV